MTAKIGDHLFKYKKKTILGLIIIKHLLKCIWTFIKWEVYMTPELKNRIRSERGESLIVSASEAAKLIKDGLAVGISGFTNAG